MHFELPEAIQALVEARNNLREHFAQAELRFTFDGNLVGDLGEAVAAQLFGLRLLPRCGTGIDAYAADGRSVQIKASGTNRGPSFRLVDTRADNLLVMLLNFDDRTGEIVYNGPENVVLKCLPESWAGQRMIPLGRLRHCDRTVEPQDRLLPVD